MEGSGFVEEINSSLLKTVNVLALKIHARVQVRKAARGNLYSGKGLGKGVKLTLVRSSDFLLL